MSQYVIVLTNFWWHFKLRDLLKKKMDLSTLAGSGQAQVRLTMSHEPQHVPTGASILLRTSGEPGGFDTHPDLLQS